MTRSSLHKAKQTQEGSTGKGNNSLQFIGGDITSFTLQCVCISQAE